MRTIHKYALDVVDHQKIMGFAWDRPLFVGTQDDNLCLWAEVDTDFNRRSAGVDIFIVGTGHDLSRLPADAKYLGTALGLGGALVWHVYTL